jgi:L-aspartate oxidase
VSVLADFVVVGSGIAGLRAAIDLVQHGRVVLLTKAGATESNTGYAQGGIAAAVGPDDSPALHLADTLAAGAGLCDPDAVEILVREGPRYVRELIDWGAAFDRDASGRPALGREGAHAVRRVLHARDTTGREIARTLWRRVASVPALQVLHHTLATRLTIDGGRCIGVEGLGVDGVLDVRAGAVLLATGGAGRVFRETTNPPIATGDGLAMAWRAGARIADLEFVQFHPTVLGQPGAPRFLISEAVRGEGARLLNADGEAFMTRYDPAGELAARDVVATAMVREAARTGRPVYLSLAHLDPDHVRSRFPGIAEACASAGLDFAHDPLPVSPAAHYMCGGVETDGEGRTSIPGLWAAGEVACTRVHGANRLASNSLLEGLVFGARAAAAMSSPAVAARLPEAVGAAALPRPSVKVDKLVAARAPKAVPDVMWHYVGLEREAEGLLSALAILEPAAAAAGRAAEGRGVAASAWAAANEALVALLIARAAWRRTESRGGHRRTDYPQRDDVHWRIHVAERRDPYARTEDA